LEFIFIIGFLPDDLYNQEIFDKDHINQFGHCYGFPSAQDEWIGKSEIVCKQEDKSPSISFGLHKRIVRTKESFK